jgi:hypothetical protein
MNGVGIQDFVLRDSVLRLGGSDELAASFLIRTVVCFDGFGANAVLVLLGYYFASVFYGYWFVVAGMLSVPINWGR